MIARGNAILDFGYGKHPKGVARSETAGAGSEGGQNEKQTEPIEAFCYNESNAKEDNYDGASTIRIGGCSYEGVPLIVQPFRVP